MEPPRIHQYDGLFTDSQSTDFVLKILTILSCFIVILLALAYHLSRKNYNRAPLDIVRSVTKLSDLYQADLCLDAWKHPKHETATFYVNKRRVLCIDDWKLVALYEQASDLDCFYSAAPKQLRRKWCGLLVADHTLPDRSQLRSALLHAFDSLPNTAYSQLGMLGSDVSLVIQYLSTSHLLDSEALDDWLWFILSEFLLFDSDDFGSANDKRSEREQLVNGLKSYIYALQRYHVHGCVSKATTVCASTTVTGLLSGLENLMTPIVQFASNRQRHRSASSENQNKRQHRTSLLHQLFEVRQQLDDEGEPVNFLTTSHVIHSMSEIFMLLRWILARQFKVLLACLWSRPKWELLLVNEVGEIFQDSRATHLGTRGSQLPTVLMLQQTDVLVWTKALVVETMRATSPSWPFGCIKQVVRDGQLKEYDYLENELVVFNQPAYLSDRQLWGERSRSNKQASHLAFDPSRFVCYASSIGNRPKLNLPVHWARFLLTGYSVCVPHETVYRLLVSMVVWLFHSGWRIHAEPNTERDHSDGSPVCLTEPLRSVSLRAPKCC